MKAKIEVEKRYKITIKGATHFGFKKVSEWEGMAKFKNKDGVVVVDQGQPDFFANIFSIFDKDKKACDVEGGFDVEIYKASPCFIPIPDSAAEEHF